MQQQLTTAVSCCIEDVWRVLHLQQDSAQAHRARETISFLVSNFAKC